MIYNIIYNILSCVIIFSDIYKDKMVRILIVFFTLGILVSCSSKVEKQQAQKLREIVIIDTNSLLLSHEYVQNYYAGAYKAVAEINASGGVLGLPLKYITEESFGNQLEAYSAMKIALQKYQPLAIMGTYNNAAAKGVARLAKENEIPFLITGAATEETIKGYYASPWTFRLRSGVDLNIVALTDAITKASNVKNAVVITYSGEEGDYISTNIKEVITKKKPNFIFAKDIRLSLRRGITDSLIKKIEESYASTLIIVIDPQELRNLDALLAGTHLSLEKHIFVMFAGEPEWLDSLGTNDTDAWRVTGFPWYNINTGNNHKFVKEYQAQYKVTPRYASYLGYIGVKILAQAITNAKVTNADLENRTKIANALTTVQVNTPLGLVKMRKDHISNLGVYAGWLQADNKRTQKGNKTYLMLNSKMADISYFSAEQYLLNEDESAANRDKFLNILAQHYKESERNKRTVNVVDDSNLPNMYKSYIFPDSSAKTSKNANSNNPTN